MKDRETFESALEFARFQVNRLLARHPGFYPMYTFHGRWKHDLPAWTHWCDGFLPGIMWILQAREAEGSARANWWREQAIRYSEPLEPRKLDRDVHDLGFIFTSAYQRWYKLSGEACPREVLIEAGRTMALRFREKGSYLRSFVSEDSLFIDIMMNVGIVFDAADQTGDERLLDIATRHSLTTQRVLVRGDGSTAHEGLFNTETGEFLRQTTHQGYRGDSCWSRGLAWAIYGFGTSYRHTQDPRFLKTAEACADFYMANTPAGGVPPWDYDAPEESRRLLDTSAAAIAAGGLLQLSGLVSDSVKGPSYRAAALLILRTLCEQHLAQSDPDWEGILKGGVYHIHKGLGVDESVMWGEYFFVEALDQALKLTEGGV
ncbi:MAG TPA: glycoside hydrolase family 88 protein [Bryobacteraceae bacterium]|nr:glycoside hydrolase family 88 protein [Bryobacteraceae bacterium]